MIEILLIGLLSWCLSTASAFAQTPETAPPETAPPDGAPSEAALIEAPTTEVLFLSGTGSDAPVDWEFRCDQGRGCGEWTTIPVPSHWELQGFGAYNYGHDEDKADEIGEYRVRFDVPSEWIDEGRQIDLVFDGVMTDAEARLNGSSAGPAHRGAFYRFRYDATDLLQPGENVLETTVRKMSEDRSVNLAERDADYWVFGGIYRPVWLRVLPPEAIDAVAIDARHDGRLRLRAEPRGLSADALIDIRVLDAAGTVVADVPEQLMGSAVESFGQEIDVRGIEPWSAENPRLYELELTLHRDGEALHMVRETFGFRTVEVRSEGLYVNDRRTLLKGVNRHAFHPDSGRSLHRALDRDDAEMIKAMNFNAVRMSHYPPDESFLEICDEIGLYVIDELTGWHDAYSTKVGRELVREMVERDRNHPSILFWANGNEDGWNTDLDELFAVHDLQQRIVLHPDVTFGGFDTEHYPTWEELEARFDPNAWKNRLRSLWNGWAHGDDSLPLVLPTEILHGLYDGGHGAGIDDYWDRIRLHPRGAGMFLWVFSDESILRTDQTDRGKVLDSDGNHAPDGIVGPYREPSANAEAVRRAFSPVVVLGQKPVLEGDVLELENRFEETDLQDCRVEWKWLRFADPGGAANLELAAGVLEVPPTGPGAVASIPLPPAPDDADALRLDFFAPDGRFLDERVIPRLDVRRQAPRWVIKEGKAVARFEHDAGGLRRIFVDDLVFPLGEGLRAAVAEDAPRIVDVRESRDGDAQLLEFIYDPGGSHGLEQALWRVEPSGWIRLSYRYRAKEGASLHGVGLPFSEDAIRSVSWLGQGPGRQWANRLQGGRLGVWTRDPAEATAPTDGHEPKFRGYRKTYWARLDLKEGPPITMVLESDDQFLGLFPPLFPEDAEEARADSPAVEGLLFLHRIPAIGTKFHPPEDLGPESAARDPGGTYRGVVWFAMGTPDDVKRTSLPAPPTSSQPPSSQEGASAQTPTPE